jgi:glycosyltransferase involved in cell wall biosynthesis
MTSLISVIICTHNPRSDYLSRVLQALDAQTLSKDLWELLVIDNLSEKILSTEIDLSWHPNSRHIREEQLGLTPARLRGIKEAVAEILVFVDDDNVLDPDHLEVALKIGKDYPFIGAWGGQIRPEFEEQPPDWTKPHWCRLAIRESEQDMWSNIPSLITCPYGAGICIRKLIASNYANLTQNDPQRINLGRKGNSLYSCDDLDLAYTACDIGLGMGRFVKLRLTHLLPIKRLKEDYLLKIAEGTAYSQIILKSLREKVYLPQKASWRGQIFELYRLWRMSPRDRRFYKAIKKGESLALTKLLNK